MKLNDIKEILYLFWPPIILAVILGFLISIASLAIFPLGISAYIGAAFCFGIILVFGAAAYPPRSRQCNTLVAIGFAVMASVFIWARPSYYEKHTPVVERTISPLAMGITHNIIWFVIPVSNDVTILRQEIATNATMGIFEIQQVLHTNRYGKCPIWKYEIVEK